LNIIDFFFELKVTFLTYRDLSIKLTNVEREVLGHIFVGRDADVVLGLEFLKLLVHGVVFI